MLIDDLTPAQIAKLRAPSSGAILSPCRTWRYALWRHWGPSSPVLFIGLNPSTADETADDMTIKKEKSYAKRWGYDGILKLNLYAYRATQPKDMVAAADPFGPDNLKYHEEYAAQAGLVVASWGALEARYRPNLRWQSHIATVLRAINKPVYCLGCTQDGSPKHTSRLAYDTPLELFWEPTAAVQKVLGE